MTTTETSGEEINLQGEPWRKNQAAAMVDELRRGREKTDLRRWSLQRLLFHP